MVATGRNMNSMEEKKRRNKSGGVGPMRHSVAGTLRGPHLHNSSLAAPGPDTGGNTTLSSEVRARGRLWICQPRLEQSAWMSVLG